MEQFEYWVEVPEDRATDIETIQKHLSMRGAQGWQLVYTNKTEGGPVHWWMRRKEA